MACQEKMGMTDGRIRDDMIMVSSSRDGNLSPRNARLDSPGAWVAQTNDKNQYLQVCSHFFILLLPQCVKELEKLVQ